MAAERYDVVVVGVGGMGAAVLYHLAKRGARACGVEQFEVAHDRGSSHGHTRIIRKAYFEHPDYVPLLDRAYELWEELEAETGQRLRVLCGLLVAGPPGSATIEGLEATYRRHALEHERLGPGAVAERYPRLRLGPGATAFFDPFGGYLFVEECVRQHVARARQLGAVLHTGERVTGWRAGADGVEVVTERRRLSAGRLVLTAGPWAGRELGALGLGLVVWRKVLFWYDAPDIGAYGEGSLPVFYVETGYGHFYGFPALDRFGLKVAEHSVPDPVEEPGAVERRLTPGDEPPVLRFLGDTFPGMRPRRTRHAVCMYTMTPDGHFILDLHPEHPRVAIGAGFSGHGFKFAPVVGEVLADLALEGRTSRPVGFLGIGRLLA